MTVGRILRKMGLPLWTFIGVGVSVTWVTYVGKLAEKILNITFRVEGASWGARYFATEIVLTAVPVILVLGLTVWHRNEANRRRMGLVREELRQPDGKKGLILLVSKETHAMRAVDYHLKKMKTLEKVWLIPSDNSNVSLFGASTRATADQIDKTCKALGLKVEIHEKGVSPADSQDTYEYVNRIFKRSGLESNEIIADFTGGTKPMTVGMIMACLPRERDLEYVPFNPTTSQMDGPFLIDYQHSAFDLVG
jgi:hypothetical protein